MAQLVEHHLAKVRVAGSNPVVRSEPRALVERPAPVCGGVAERRGNGLQSRLHGFKSRLHLVSLAEHERGGGTGRKTGRAIGAVVARFPDTEEVTGSNPVSPTTAEPQAVHGLPGVLAFPAAARRRRLRCCWRRLEIAAITSRTPSTVNTGRCQVASSTNHQTTAITRKPTAIPRFTCARRHWRACACSVSSAGRGSRTTAAWQGRAAAATGGTAGSTPWPTCASTSSPTPCRSPRR